MGAMCQCSRSSPFSLSVTERAALCMRASGSPRQHRKRGIPNRRFDRGFRHLQQLVPLRLRQRERRRGACPPLALISASAPYPTTRPGARDVAGISVLQAVSPRSRPRRWRHHRRDDGPLRMPHTRVSKLRANAEVSIPKSPSTSCGRSSRLGVRMMCERSELATISVSASDQLGQREAQRPAVVVVWSPTMMGTSLNGPPSGAAGTEAHPRVRVRPARPGHVPQRR